MFKITTAHSDKLNSKDPEDLTVSEAIHTIYPGYNYIDTVYWNRITIQIDRKGDLSSIYNDIVQFVHDIRSGANAFKESFLSSTCTAEFEVRKKDKQLIIIPRFYDVRAFQNGIQIPLSTLKNMDHELEISEEDFLTELYKLLRSVNNDLLSAGYSVQDLEDFGVLVELLE